ncbi:MAG: hypothetical protein HGA31_03855 [Candidatus Moranbacteria bacterium]|nr:hypothetical protein [Candidatus Moranbacteria bacterium]
MSFAADVREFRLGHVLATFLMSDLMLEGETFPMTSLASFMFGVSIDPKDLSSAIAECQRELIRQFRRFGSHEFIGEFARLSVLFNAIADDRDVMSIISKWYLELLPVFGDSFQIRRIRSTFCFLDEAERSIIAANTEGQDAELN